MSMYEEMKEIIMKNGADVEFREEEDFDVISYHVLMFGKPFWALNLVFPKGGKRFKVMSNLPVERVHKGRLHQIMYANYLNSRYMWVKFYSESTQLFMMEYDMDIREHTTAEECYENVQRFNRIYADILKDIEGRAKNAANVEDNEDYEDDEMEEERTAEDSYEDLLPEEDE